MFADLDRRKGSKHILSIFLCLCLLGGSLPMILPAHAAGPGNVNVNDGDSATYHAVRLNSGDVYAYRAIVQAPFSALSIQLATGGAGRTGSCTIAVYRWDRDYSTTVAGTPLASRHIDSLQDNSWNEVTTSDTLAAGEYLFCVLDPVDNVLVWTDTPATPSKGFVYRDGAETAGDDPKMQVKLTEAVEEPFGQCAPSQDPHIDQMVPQGGSGQKAINFTTSMGVRLRVAAPFSGVQFRMATYMQTDMQISISVYEWKGNYSATVEAAPLATGRFTMTDNALQGITFDKLPAGDYLMLAHDPSSGPGMYYYSEVEAFEGVAYREGFAVDEAMSLYPQCSITFNRDLGDEPYFLPCEDSDEGVSGDHVPPAEYEIPADSLIHTHEVMPDTWVFTDGLGRVSLTNAEVGDVREDRTVAMFYWTWHIDNQAASDPANLQELSQAYPEAMNDYDHELWSTVGGAYFWNEPIYGYYRSDDEWVLRRQAELLTNAGVDVIFADNTNGTMTWRNGYTPLMETWTDAMTDGVRTPKVAFMLPFSATDSSKQQLQSLYMDIYREGKWHNLWYYLDGKPMIAAHIDNLDATLSNMEKEILNFFTFRQNHPTYTHAKQDKPHEALGEWGWLSLYPQMCYYGERSDITAKQIEQTTVGVAMNHDYVNGQICAMNGTNIMGRSYTSTGYHTETDAKLWGYNFAEQFEYALEKDPEILFVTGWNEWRAGRYEEWYGVENAFPDQFNDEYSRDIEPSKGDLQDHYYYQLVNYVRQYKGATAIPTPSGKTTIDMTAGTDQWQTVEPYYAAYIGNTDDRDAQGYGTLTYTETSGRNDIIGAQVARDDEFVYFLVECAENITAYTDKLWMNLYIDAAGDGALDGWNSFDYVVNKTAPTATTAVLERFTGNGYASEKVADVEYTVDGRYMTVKIAKADLGLSGDDYTVNFAWTDNVHDEGNYDAYSGDIMDFYISGDVAPGGRFKYSYISTAENAGETETSDVETNAPTETDTTPATDDPTEPATDAPDEGGCKSAVGSAAALTLLAGAAVIALRKKDD